MTQELEKTRDSSTQFDEKAIKDQLEQTYKERFAFKEQELEDVNAKLARISQANIEFKTKCDRLETGNAEISDELN
jgi:hypothetical protein